MLNLGTVLLVLGAMAAPATSPPSACPATPWRAKAPIYHLIDHQSFQILHRPKLDALTHEDIVPLQDEQVCEALNKFYAGSTFDKGKWRRAYFQTGGYYMASIYYQGEAPKDVRKGHVIIFSGKLRLVYGFMNNI